MNTAIRLRPRAWWLTLGVCLALLVWGGIMFTTSRAQEGDGDPVQEELDTLKSRVPSFDVVTLPRAGTSMTLTNDDSLTIEDLRGVTLDDTPPEFIDTPPTHSANMGDGLTDGTRPFIAEDIAPFRFRYFTNELVYGGWHNYNMYDYLMRHGFNVLNPYATTISYFSSYMPADTTYMSAAGFDWNSYMTGTLGLTQGRWDTLVDWEATNGSLATRLINDNKFAYTAGYANYMIDLEHGSPLDEATLRTQAWYPSGGTTEEKAAFEKKYYDGYALTHRRAIQAAYTRGWRDISIYGNADPYPRTWSISGLSVDPTYWRWQRYLQQIYRDPALALVNDSIYCFYGQTGNDQLNPAYMLGNVDLNQDLILTETERKRVRPYTWTCFHGGGGGWRWWRSQPETNEQMRAEIALLYFAGLDGMVNWNWSGTGSHHVAPTLPSTQPTGWWKLNENTGTSTADATGNGYGGTLTNGAAWSASGPYAPFGSCVSFDGTNDYITLGAPAGLNISGNISMSAWIKVTADADYAGTRYIVGHGTTTFLRIKDGYYETGCYASGADHLARVAIPTGTGGDANKWVHLSGVYDGSKWRLYKDGAQVNELTYGSGAQSSGSNWAIGAAGDGASGYFKGYIDDVRVKNAALDATGAVIVAFQYDVTAKDDFSLTPDGGGATYNFTRYQPLHVYNVNGSNVTFQPLDRASWSAPFGLTSTTGYFTLSNTNFNTHVRVAGEAVAGMVEGMALVKPFEYALRHGDVKIDVSAQSQFQNGSVIIRRVKCGNTNIVITYDPKRYDDPGTARPVTLTNFDGHAGMNITFPADATPRIFVLKDYVEDEVDHLRDIINDFHTVDLPSTGTVNLANGDSYTIEDLRGEVLDLDAPELGTPDDYSADRTDGLGSNAPYIASDINNFRFKYFTNELEFTGNYNWNLHDYASVHGFNVLYPDGYTPASRTWMPADTQWIQKNTLYMTSFMSGHGIGAGRYDQLMDWEANHSGETLTEHLIADGNFNNYNSAYDYVILEGLTHTCLDETTLRQQVWYPSQGTPEEKAAFETKYYDGYARSFVAPIECAKYRGWDYVSVRGWQPYHAGVYWWGLGTVALDPATDWRWNRYGKTVYNEGDLASLTYKLNTCYWTNQHPAWTLAQTDLNLKLANSEATKKPERPYYTIYMESGGGGWRWWGGQPLLDEEMRAIVTGALFTGTKGVMLNHWTSTTNQHLPPAIAVDADLMVKDNFTCVPDGGTTPYQFVRYDVVHITAINGNNVTFQLIRKTDSGNNYGVGGAFPYYTMVNSTLSGHLRAKTEPVRAFVEGLALAKVIEYGLSHGEVIYDDPTPLTNTYLESQEFFDSAEPIIRRVKLGETHLVMTYDPKVKVDGTAPRTISLADFDGKTGLTVNFPADDQVRIFILRENVAPTASITAPTDNSYFNAPTNFIITATASDSDGVVEKVEFYADGVKIGDDLRAPYHLSWNDAPLGTHALTVKAIDDDGTVTTSSTVNITVLDQNLIGFWRCEDGSGTTVDDCTEYNNNAAFVNTPTWTTGKYGGGLQFDGTDDHLQVNASTSLSGLSTAVTVACWAKSDTATWNAYGMLMSKRDCFVLHPVPGTKTLQFYVYTNGGWAAASYTTTVDLTQWHHYAGTYDGAYIRLYIDGAPVASAARTGTLSDTGPMTIGRDETLARYFDGTMDEMRLYNRALSNPEIAAIAQ